MIVMFSYTMRLNSGSDLAREYDRFLDKLNKSEVSVQERPLVANQVEDMITQYRRHLDMENVRQYTSDRMISGNGYRIRVSVGETFLSNLINFFRG